MRMASQRIFLRRHAAEKGEVFARLEARLVGAEVAAIVDDRKLPPELARDAACIWCSLMPATCDLRPAAQAPIRRRDARLVCMRPEPRRGVTARRAAATRC